MGWYSEEGTAGRGRSPPRPLIAVRNVTVHPSTASVQGWHENINDYINYYHVVTCRPYSSTQTSADGLNGQRLVSSMTDGRGDTWSPFGMSQVRSRSESLVADCSMLALHAATGIQGRRGRQE